MEGGFWELGDERARAEKRGALVCGLWDVDFSLKIAPESDTNAWVITLGDTLRKQFSATANESSAKSLLQTLSH